ncbi:MAG: leucine-rich repeat domain-containing protein [Treponema sp.]|nr:leucine-rich repeat domain-containing protein [Candidatus Treponema merdequi]
MSKKTLTVIASYVFILLLTVFTGCQNLTSFNLNGTFENPNSEITKNETPYLTFNFYGGNEKTVNPVFDCSKLTAITLKGTVTDGVEETLFTEKTYAEITAENFTVQLTKTGTYSFVMTAKLNERNYSCSLSNIEIKNGKNALSFSMSFINQDENFVPGNGNIQINLKIKNHSDIKYAKVCLLKNDGTPAFNEEKIDNSNSGTFTYTKSNVPAGNYTVKYSFYNGENLLGYYMETVNVSKDLSSTAIREVEAVAQYYKITYALGDGSWVEGYEGASAYSKFGIASLPSWDKAFKGNDGVAGWYYDESFIDKATEENIKTKTGDITLYPKYDLIAYSDGFGDLINRIKASGVNETRQIKILDADPDLEKITNALKDENVTVGIDLSECTKLKSLPGYCFMSCTSLTKITIPEEVKVIGEYAFKGCSLLESINLPKGITVIEEFTFDGCSKLNNIVIPNGVTTIGTAAFRNCTSLTEIKIPVSVVSIGKDEYDSMAYWTFNNCTKLSKVTAPCRFKVNENFKKCFEGCSSDIIFEYDEHTFTGENILCDCGVEKTDCEEGPCGTDAKFYFVNRTGILTITGSGDVTVNNFSAFASEIKSVKIDDTITGVYPGMFTEFTSLREVNAPCSAIKNAGIDESKVTVISHHIYGKYDDDHCICGKSTQKKLERKWGDSIKCTYYDGSKVALFTGSGTLSDNQPDIFAGTQDPDYISYQEIVKAETVEICDGITGIGYRAFHGKNWKNMKVLKMADSVTSIGREVFSNLPLTKITLSKALDAIDNNAFSGCSSLENLVIPDSVSIIGSEVFMNCSNLKTIRIGNGIETKKMGGDIFKDCPSDVQITAPEKLNGNSCLKGFTNITWY